MVEKLLPLGTIVKLKVFPKKLMIIGFLQYSKNNENKIYDYTAVTYPQGQISSKYSIHFDNSDIEEIVYRGYEDEDWEKFSNELREFVNNQQTKEGE